MKKISLLLILLCSHVLLAEEPLELLRPLHPPNHGSDWSSQLPMATHLLPKPSDYSELPVRKNVNPVQDQPNPFIAPTEQPLREPIPSSVNTPEPTQTLSPSSSVSLDSESSQENCDATEDILARTDPKETSSTGDNQFFWQIHIREGMDLAQMREYRRSFLATYGDLVRDQKFFMSMDRAAMKFNILLKPMLEEGMAQNLCKKLQERGGECVVVKKKRFKRPIGWQVQVIATKNLAQTREYKKFFAKRHADIVKNQRLTISLTESGELFRLRLGPTQEVKRANAWCDKLKSRGVACIVVKTRMR